MKYYFLVSIILIGHVQKTIIANPDSDPVKLLRDLEFSADIQNKYLEILSILDTLERKSEKTTKSLPDYKPIFVPKKTEEKSVTSVKRKRSMSLTAKLMKLWKGSHS